MIRRPPKSPLFPYPALFPSQPWYSTSALADVDEINLLLVDGPPGNTSKLARYPAVPALRDKLGPGATVMLDEDRKSTRLNSSHANISYAVFCLKKKKTVRPH